MAAYRIDAGTDIACVGIWDAELPPAKHSIEGEALNASAARGELLPIYTHADGSYPLRILVEEPFVPPEEQRFVTLEREFGLDLRSGTALVGGCEDFRNPRPRITTDRDRIRVEPSWYRARVHLNVTDGDLLEALAHTEAEKALTSEEHARYRQLGKHYNRGCALQLIAVALGIGSVLIRGVAGLVGGAMAVLLMAAAFWSRRLGRTGYDALHRRYQRALEAAHPPTIVLELHRAEGPLPGGSVALEDTPEA
nr:hypothetical protein [Archangium sp.]